MRQRFSLAMAVVVVILTSQLVGCGSGLRLTEVKGRLFIDGEPKENILVQFMPDITKETEGPESTGITDKDGYFTLKVRTGEDGAVVGWHRVVLEDLKQDRLPQGQTWDQVANPPRVGDRYTTFAKTPIRIEVITDKSEYKLIASGFKF